MVFITVPTLSNFGQTKMNTAPNALEILDKYSSLVHEAHESGLDADRKKASVYFRENVEPNLGTMVESICLDQNQKAAKTYFEVGVLDSGNSNEDFYDGLTRVIICLGSPSQFFEAGISYPKSFISSLEFGIKNLEYQKRITSDEAEKLAAFLEKVDVEN